MLWGLVFVAPLMLPDYGPGELALGRYLAFGLVAAVIGLWQRKALRSLERADWIEALKLAAVGNLLYYVLLAAAIQRSGGPLATLIIATLPLVIPLSAALARADRDATRIVRQMRLPMLGILLGLLLVYRQEWAVLPESIASGDARDRATLFQGAILGVGALACWTWYPIRNALWLQRRTHLHPGDWATAQGLATLALSVLALPVLAFLSLMAGTFSAAPLEDQALWQRLLGPRPFLYLGLMLLLGLLASWVGTWLWNQASTRLPASIAGMLIVFEGIFALLYVYFWRGESPGLESVCGIASLIGGVLWGLHQATRDPADSRQPAPGTRMS